MKLWHDDVRPPPSDEWTWARTNAEARELLLNNDVVEASLDHDLGYHDIELPDDPDELVEVTMLRGTSPDTGWYLVKWMVDNPEVIPPVVRIHSWNPAGAQRMATYLHDTGLCKVYILPFMATEYGLAQ